MLLTVVRAVDFVLILGGPFGGLSFLLHVSRALSSQLLELLSVSPPVWPRLASGSMSWRWGVGRKEEWGGVGRREEEARSLLIIGHSRRAMRCWTYTWPLAVVGQMVQVASGCCWSIGPGGQRSPQGYQSQFTRGGRTAATETVKIENP